MIKTPKSFAENWQKSQKVMIIASTPANPEKILNPRFESFSGKVEADQTVKAVCST
jgi:hypothetical protein